MVAHPLAAEHAEYLDQLARVPMTLGRTSDGKLFMRSPLPNEVAFESLATRLRPLIAQGDDLHFEKAFSALEQLVVADEDKYRDIRQHVLDEWRTQTERSDRTRAYRMMTVDDDVSDVTLAFAWLYGDSIHGDHDKVEKHEVLDRFRAAVGFFSGVAVVAVATLNLIRQLVELGVVDLPGTAFTDDVVVTQREIRVEVAKAYHTDVGADMTDVLKRLLERTGEDLPPNVRPVQELMDQLREQRADDDGDC